MSELEAILERIQAAETDREAFDAYSSGLVQFGYNNACFSLMTDHPSISQDAFHGFATDYPESWMNFYKANEYHRFDPVYNLVLEKQSAFYWRDISSNPDWIERFAPETISIGDKVMKEGAEAGVADGIGLSFCHRYGEISGIGISVRELKKTEARSISLRFC